MTVAEFIVDFLIANGVTDVFGYQGGMIAYVFDAMGKRKEEIRCHGCATEQGAALAACGYAQATGRTGVVLSTSGPGFTNLLTGIANAWFDSIPVICISGQVNTKDKRRSLPVRQMGFQEIQAPLIAASMTKGVYEIDDGTDIQSCLEEAWELAAEGRKGPVFLELPINICRNEISVERAAPKPLDHGETCMAEIQACLSGLLKAKKPVLIAGAGICQAGLRREFRELVQRLDIPVITTLPAVDLLPADSRKKLGYLGGTARREAGIALAAADAVLAMGTRLCAKQIGYHLERFAPRAKLYRVDIDRAELERRLKEDEIQIHMTLDRFIKGLLALLPGKESVRAHSDWLDKCAAMKEILADCDVTFGNRVIRRLTGLLPDGFNITLDVGNNMIYGAQSSVIKENTRVFVSGGFGAMGYSLPAAMGATIGNMRPTCAIVGDGGMQMNIQELNIIAREKLPVKIFVMNNRALGHILLFQKAYLEGRYVATDERMGDYFSCDFAKIAAAYGIQAYKLTDSEDIADYEDALKSAQPVLFELEYPDCSLLPNIHGGCDCLTSEPRLGEEVIRQIMDLGFPLLEASV